MAFEYSAEAQQLQHDLRSFMNERVLPAEDVFERQMVESGNPHGNPPILEELKTEAKSRKLWNLFLPHKTEWTSGLSNLDYAPLAEIMGRSDIASEACNCSAPDTGNMEILTMFGSPQQQQDWLVPLLNGEIRSAFSMTEPDVASSDATNIECRIEADGDDYVINGRKWWTSGSADERCALLIVMGKTDPSGPRHRQQSMILVPRTTPGVTIVRNLPVFGFIDRHGHCEIIFDNVRVPRSNLLGEEGSGFQIAQARLGPGRIHHCMRAIGVAERALELMCQRVTQRTAFGGTLADKGTIQNWIANARIEIDQSRLYVLYTADLMDREGNRVAANEISGIKVAIPRMALKVIDHAIQSYGAAGICDDFGLSSMWAHTRTLRIVDGPDEVHLQSIARRELRKFTDA